MWLGSGFGCAPPLLAGVLGCVCARVRASLVPRHSWLGCVVWVCVWARVLAAPRHSWLGCWGVCVFVCPFRLYPAIPGWDVRRGCVCLGLGFGCAPPLLAGVLGCVCVCVPAPLVPRISWLGCVVCVCVCLGSGFGCAPPLLAGVLGCVCVCVPAPLVPRHSWLGCVLRVCVWARVLAAPRHSWLGCWGVCVFVCPLRFYPATPGWGVRRGSECLGSGFGCAPPLVAGVLGCVCVCVPAPLVPRHSWLGCVVCVCVFGLGFRLRPTTPGWGVGVCVCSCPRSACTPPLLAGVCGVVCVLVPRFRPPPATPGWGVGVCVCLCARSACTPPLLTWVCGVGVCACAPVSAAPRHSWLGCWGVCVFVCPLRLYPATPGWGVWCRCVCSGSGFGCAPPLLAGVLGCVCVRAPAPLVPRHSWLGFWGVCVCAWARVSAAPHHSWLGC